MLIRLLASIALLAGFAGFTACSGGSGNTGSVVVACDGIDANAMCLVSCNLGCSATGCQITEIAQNQPLTFDFSQPIDPASVNSGTVSIRTAQGEEPVGALRVVGSRIEFVPEIQLSGGTSFFGFKAAETYVLTLQGGADNLNALRSTSGDPLDKSVSCSLAINGGIVDLNGQPPSARLVTPSQTGGVPIGTEIVLEFNEVIDPAPFQGTTAADGPVRYRMRRTSRNGSGELECNPPTSESVVVLGSPRVNQDTGRNITVVSFQSATPFPGEVCIEVEITSAVRDVSGTAAQPQLFQFITETTVAIEQSSEELFADETNLDRNASAGTWAGGQGVFGELGGSGELGVFDVANGGTLFNSVYTWDTDLTTIVLPSGSVTITDGIYEFSDFVLDAGTTLRFIGSVAPQITATGRLEVNGTIDVSGLSPNGGSSPQVVIDRIGARGGPGGGRGGSGGVAGTGTSHLAANDGGEGATITVPASHAFASQVAGTGGRGARQFPLNGLNSSLIFTGFFSQMPGAGGGGGGFLAPGAMGQAVSSGAGDPAQLGPPAQGGGAFDILGALSKPAGIPSRDFYLIGGSGGGAGGSHALFSLAALVTWRDGAGGGGGGGAIALRAGHSLVVSPTGSVLARGGAGNSYTAGSATGVPAPGGGGSGGSIFLQSGGLTDVAGTVDASGGAGGVVQASAGLFSANIAAGDGSDGYVRLEFVGAAAGNPTQLLPSALPAATTDNLGDLQDGDTLTSFTSGWYFTGQLFGPKFVRYEIDALVDGVATTFSDDPAVSAVPALAGMAPIQAQFQGAQLDPITGQPQFGVDKPFRSYVGRALNPSQLALSDDGLNGFRFQVFLDRSFGQQVVLTRVAVYYQF